MTPVNKFQTFLIVLTSLLLPTRALSQDAPTFLEDIQAGGTALNSLEIREVLSGNTMVFPGAQVYNGSDGTRKALMRGRVHESPWFVNEESEYCAISAASGNLTCHLIVRPTDNEQTGEFYAYNEDGTRLPAFYIQTGRPPGL